MNSLRVVKDVIGKIISVTFHFTKPQFPACGLISLKATFT